MGVTVETIGPPVNDLSIGQWVKQATIAAAERALIEEVGKGFDAEPVVVTDGVPRRDYHDVRPFGTIQFIARPRMTEAVLWALEELRKISPVGRGPDGRPGHPGFYRSSHLVLINGEQIVGDIKAALDNVKPDDRVQIVNTAVYARKIEGATANARTGRGRRKASSRQAKGGVYRVVMQSLVRRYGRSIFFDFKYVKLNTGVKVWGMQGGGRKRGKQWVGHALRQKVRRDQVYPALQFFIKPGTGLLN
jgi:hypothetical protein